MSEYVEISVDKLELDKSNPRIGDFLDLYDINSLTAEQMQMLLGTSDASCAALKQSIRENNGIINPIIVNHDENGEYIVIEGNTRLQIYRDFRNSNVPGDWSKIKAIVYEDLSPSEMHAIRLQSHLVGTREWEAYAKAKYLYHLSIEESWPMTKLIAFCGGNTKASEIRNMIHGYQDMEKYYRTICDEDAEFEPKKFHGFVELQKTNVLNSLKKHGYTKADFAIWMKNEKFDKLEHVRRLSEILDSKNAREAFFKDGSKQAIKVLAVEEISPDSLKDVPYEMLAKELSKRMFEFPAKEVNYLQNDAEYIGKLEALEDVVSSVRMVLDMVHTEE